MKNNIVSMAAVIILTVLCCCKKNSEISAQNSNKNLLFNRVAGTYQCTGSAITVAHYPDSTVRDSGSVNPFLLTLSFNDDGGLIASHYGEEFNLSSHQSPGYVYFVLKDGDGRHDANLKYYDSSKYIIFGWSYRSVPSQNYDETDYCSKIE